MEGFTALQKKTFLVAARRMFIFSSHVLTLNTMGFFHIHMFCGVLLWVLRFGNAWKWRLRSCAWSQGLDHCAPLCLGLQHNLSTDIPIQG